jgi:hypothetical protein
MTPNYITSLHVDRGRQMRTIVQADIACYGYSFEQAVGTLAEYLGVQVESVKLGIAVANAADDGTLETASRVEVGT